MANLGANTQFELVALCRDKARPQADRVQACLLLGQMKFREALPNLIEIVQQEHEGELVWQSLATIGAIGSRRATRPLLQLLRSTTSAVTRHGAVLGLMQLADERTRGELTRIAANKQEEENTRALATEALGLLKSKRRTSRFLIGALHDPSPAVRFSSLCAIGALKDRTALPFIRPLLNDSSIADGAESIGDRANLVLRSMQE
jgi:HEAT repeat protein